MPSTEYAIDDFSLRTFVSQNVSEGLPFSRRIFEAYVREMLFDGDIKTKMDEASNVYDVLEEDFVPMMFFDDRIKNLRDKKLKMILISAIQFQDINSFKFLFSRVFSAFELAVMCNGSLAFNPVILSEMVWCTDWKITSIVIKTDRVTAPTLTDELKEVRTLVARTQPSFAVCPFVTTANKAAVEAALTDELRLLISIVKPARLLCLIVPTVWLDTTESLTSYGTVVTNLLFGKTYAEVSDWIEEVTEATLTDWSAGSTVVDLDIRKYYLGTSIVYEWNSYYKEVKEIKIESPIGGVVTTVFEFVFSSDLYIEGDTYNDDSCWRVSAMFTM